MANFRTEKDSLGEVQIPEKAYWGAQTQRALESLGSSREKMPFEIVAALLLVKKAAALVNGELGVLSQEKASLIVSACEEILSGGWEDQFPLSLWQMGAGTQTHMNVNEVIANCAIAKSGGVVGSRSPIDPHDDVNCGQSTNDLFPTAMHMALVRALRERLQPALTVLKEAFKEKSEAFKEIVKVGRTHLMDAVPLTLGQEFSGYCAQVEHALESLTRAFLLLQELAIGGTAVGTGLNAPKNFGRRVCTLLAEWEQFPYMPARNAFEAQACHDPLIELSGILRRMACSLFKIANDLRWLASGPRCGLGELKLPVHEEGSTMMPGKFNPTQCEIVLMRMIQQQGCDVACAIGGMQGQFELHGMKPLLLHNLLRSIDLIAESAQTFTFQCVKGIQPNLETLRKNVHNNLMSVTALSPEIGYEKASEVVLKAQNEGLSIEEAAKKLGVNFRY